MAKHTKQYKIKCVALLKQLNKGDNLILPSGVMVKNVRELVQELDISSYSLYNWAKLYSKEKSEINDDSDDDFFDDEIDSQNGKKGPSGEKVIFNQRYYGWFAGMLGIKGYSNMLVPQLKLVIGNELIRQSGLIDMNKAKKQLSKNGEGL